MKSICNSLSLKTLFYFCDYKEKNVFKRILNYFYGNVFSVFMKSSNKPSTSYFSIYMALFVKIFFALTTLSISIGLVYFLYGEHINIYFSMFKIWFDNKCNESKINISKIIIFKFLNLIFFTFFKFIIEEFNRQLSLIQQKQIKKCN